MTTPREILGHISGGKVLDVATGDGGFISFLLEGFQSYTEITGIDCNDKCAACFAELFKEKPNIHFVKMDATKLDFPDASFDTVCISNSIHHLQNPKAILAEMIRVLRPGGLIIISEMYRDNQTDTQMTHVHLHHWLAAVDKTKGIVHNETYTRQQLLNLILSLGMNIMTLNDFSDLSKDPLAADTIQNLNKIIDQYLQRAENHPDLQARSEELHQRVSQIGYHDATNLIAILER